jgi:hypothetical protein
VFDALQQYCSKAKGGPLGEAEVILKDVNGTPHVFWFETFYNRHEALTLAYYVKEHRVIIAVP